MWRTRDLIWRSRRDVENIRAVGGGGWVGRGEARRGRMRPAASRNL